MKLKKRELKKNKLLKSKSAEGILGMSFSMIFSIILIIFFIMIAFIAIRAFLNWQRCAQVGLFFEDLDGQVKRAMNSNGMSTRFNYSLPSGIQYVCFFNMTSLNTLGVQNGNAIEISIWDYIKGNENRDYSKTAYIYSPGKRFCNLAFKEIKYLDFSSKNINCIKVINNKVSILVEKRFENPTVSLGS